MTIRPRVYVETTIPSTFHETRTAPDIVARRDWTRRWNCPKGSSMPIETAEAEAGAGGGAATDPVIEEIRAIRRRISERLGHDPQRIFDYHIRWQRLYDAGTAPTEIAALLDVSPEPPA